MELGVQAADRGVGEDEVVDGAAADGEAGAGGLDLGALVGAVGDPQHHPSQRTRVLLGRREGGRETRLAGLGGLERHDDEGEPGIS
jgi:hypothetical protein